jgi:eukaryotic-like serine/threonine-protein kinase
MGHGGPSDERDDQFQAALPSQTAGRFVMTDDTSCCLIARWREGDQNGAAELFGRYYAPLVAMVRGRLSMKLYRRFDPEDVVQSAFRRFFLCARADRFVFRDSGDLGRLLATITLHCLRYEVKWHTAGKRSVDRERSLGDERSGSVCDFIEVEARDGSPTKAVAEAEELERVLGRLAPLHRRMVELRAQGYRFEEIAADTHRSERLVRRVLERVKVELSHRA